MPSVTVTTDVRRSTLHSSLSSLPFREVQGYALILYSVLIYNLISTHPVFLLSLLSCFQLMQLDYRPLGGHSIVSTGALAIIVQSHRD